MNQMNQSTAPNLPLKDADKDEHQMCLDPAITIDTPPNKGKITMLNEGGTKVAWKLFTKTSNRPGDIACKRVKKKCFISKSFYNLKKKITGKLSRFHTIRAETCGIFIEMPERLTVIYLLSTDVGGILLLECDSVHNRLRWERWLYIMGVTKVLTRLEMERINGTFDKESFRRSYFCDDENDGIPNNAMKQVTDEKIEFEVINQRSVDEAKAQWAKEEATRAKNVRIQFEDEEIKGRLLKEGKEEATRDNFMKLHLEAKAEWTREATRAKNVRIQLEEEMETHLVKVILKEQATRANIMRLQLEDEEMKSRMLEESYKERDESVINTVQDVLRQLVREEQEREENLSREAHEKLSAFMRMASKDEGSYVQSDSFIRLQKLVGKAAEMPPLTCEEKDVVISNIMSQTTENLRVMGKMATLDSLNELIESAENTFSRARETKAELSRNSYMNINPFGVAQLRKVAKESVSHLGYNEASTTFGRSSNLIMPLLANESSPKRKTNPFLLKDNETCHERLVQLLSVVEQTTIRCPRRTCNDIENRLYNSSIIIQNSLLNNNNASIFISDDVMNEKPPAFISEEGLNNSHSSRSFIESSFSLLSPTTTTSKSTDVLGTISKIQNAEETQDFPDDSIHGRMVRNRRETVEKIPSELSFATIHVCPICAENKNEVPFCLPTGRKHVIR
eukprot:Tbor_TRINITY_DN3800_c0_g1::TRINITY_DN3800_c0_g1_i1::g.5583::m.5583